MNSLFWKIFISFWLSLILFASLTLWSTSHYLENVRARTHQTKPHQQLLLYLEQSQTVAKQHGITGLQQWAKHLDKLEAIPYFLIDQNGEDILGRSVPYRLQQRITRLEHRYRHEDDDHEEREYRRPHHRPVIINGKRYRLVADFQNITLGRVLSRPRVIAIPVIIALLISGGVCFLLARYLTSPISRLREATNKMASGDLSHRVSPSMGKRRDEIVELANDFDHMAEQLAALIASHKQLLRDASHELRSPLARLQVALGLARQDSSNEDNSELDRIEKETERLNDLIGQLLSLARLETGTVKIPFSPVDITSLVEDITSDAAYEAQAMGKDVKITTSILAIIEGNEVLLHSALENIIRNAIRYTEVSSSVEISIDHAAGNTDQFEIKVRDYGPGLPDDMLEHIFEPFVRVGEARDRTSGGYGLGLAIASRAIKLHKGTITARNEPDKGMSIIIQLPIKKG